MSLVRDIFEELWNKTLHYKGIPVNGFGIPKFKNSNPNSLKTTLCNLKRRKLLARNKDGWILTKKGEGYYKERYLNPTKLPSPFETDAPRNLLLMFDVPHEKSRYRDWLRRQLQEYDYIMVQKSVWAGPSPLPKEFKDYIKMIKIEDCIKTFRLAKYYKQK
ncbi:MAG: hypothetical protein V4438_02135 [Patescibacteria group bacterium]